MFLCPIVHFLIFNLFYISEFFDADDNVEALGQVFPVLFGYWEYVLYLVGFIAMTKTITKETWGAKGLFV